MKNLIKKYFSLILSVIIFISFGLYHIAKFETIDEHFWKYDRIEKYFNGIKEHNLKKTRINDKPGVTVALISGIGLPFSPSLSGHEDVNRENNHLMPKDNGKMRKLYTLYKTNETQKLNYALRLPILLFNGLVMLPLIFWLLGHAFDRRVASIGIMLIGLNPILIGISQIINPDALLWSFSTAAILSFFALLRTDNGRDTINHISIMHINKNFVIFTILTGIFTGFALLSKYSANLLFIFFAIAYIFKSIENKNYNQNFLRLLQSYGKKLLPITLISWLIITFFMPAVLIAPKHFLYATIYSPVLKPIVLIFAKTLNLTTLLFEQNESYKIIPLAIFSLLIFTIIFIIIPPIIVFYLKKNPKILHFMGKFAIIALLSIFIISFINAWFNTPIFLLDNLKEVSRSSGSVSFPQFVSDNTFIFWFKALLVQSQNFIFSLTPIVVLAFIILDIFTLTNKKTKYISFIYFANIVPFIFFGGAMLSNVFVNVRYSLMLYPIFMIIGAMSVIAICNKITWKFKKQFFLILILLTGFYSLWNIKPFYFNYTSSLLPHRYVVTDSWGYGFYEAAQYLNSLPNAKDLVVWSDRAGLCQFFIGKCINSREIYLDYTNIDYLLLTRRGTLIRKPVPITKYSKKTISFTKYYKPKYFNNSSWKLNIDNRPNNFIKLLKINN